MLRISFLEQAAAILINQSNEANDEQNCLSKVYLEEMREIMFLEQIRMDKNSKRNICKNCQRIWFPNKNGDSGFKIAKKGRKLIKTCTDCNQKKEYVMDSKYKSRNEK